MNQTFYRRNAYSTPYAEPYRPAYEPPPLNYGPVWSNTQPNTYVPPRPANSHPYAVNQSAFRQTSEPYYNQPKFNHAGREPNVGEKLVEKPEKTDLLKSIQRQWYNAWYKTWIKEELNFSMNKISMAGLLFGLMFLGSVFFLIGFLVAVNLYGTKHVSGPELQPRSLIPSYGAQLSGRTGQPMNAQYTPINNVQYKNQNSTHIPTSFQNQSIVSNTTKARTPSFQTVAPNTSSFQNSTHQG
jgi:hypothetical protein